MDNPLPTLDAHAHLHPARFAEELNGCGAVLAMTVSLEEGAMALRRQPDALIAWGAGCHPRILRHQQAFEADCFRALVEQTAVVGELGLDCGSRVPMQLQQRVFRQALQVLSGLPRLVSIHSYQACRLVLDALRECPISVPVLHWWTGTALETSEAVQLGCYFSLHSQVARQSKFRTHVPRERLLLESDHGYGDPPPAIPCRIGWVEYLVAQQYQMDVVALRRLVWANFGRIIQQTGTVALLPEGMQEILRQL
jgi:TatD DNase family protein